MPPPAQPDTRPGPALGAHVRLARVRQYRDRHPICRRGSVVLLDDAQADGIRAWGFEKAKGSAAWATAAVRNKARAIKRRDLGIIEKGERFIGPTGLLTVVRATHCAIYAIFKSLIYKGYRLKLRNTEVFINGQIEHGLA